MSLEKRVAAKGSPVIAWHIPSKPQQNNILQRHLQTVTDVVQKLSSMPASSTSRSSSSSSVEAPFVPPTSLPDSPLVEINRSFAGTEQDKFGEKVEKREGKQQNVKAIDVIPPLQLAEEASYARSVGDKSAAVHAVSAPNSPPVPISKFSRDPPPQSRAEVPDDHRRAPLRAPPGLAPPPGFETSPPVASNENPADAVDETFAVDGMLGRSRLGGLAPDPWSSGAGIDFIQSLPLGSLALGRESSVSSQINVASSLGGSGVQRNDTLPLTTVIGADNSIGRLSSLSQPVSTSLQTRSSLGDAPLQVREGLGEVGQSHHSHMGLFNVEKFLGFLDEDENQEDEESVSEDPQAYSPLVTFRRDDAVFEADIVSEEDGRDLWDPSSGEIISPSLVRARPVVATVIGGERGAGGSNAPGSPSGWMRRTADVDVTALAGLGSGLLRAVSDEGVDVGNASGTKRNAFFAHWMGEATEDDGNRWTS